MAEKEISELTSKTTPVGTDEFEIQETGGGTSKKTTQQAMWDATATDSIAEKTGAAGVTVDGVLLKDGAVTASGGIVSGGDILSDTDSTDSIGSTAVRWLKGWFDTIEGTLSTAAQTNVTSVGTLTALQVDNLNLNGNTLSSTAGTDLLITPLAGQQIVLDGAIIVDAGVVTGATSITSTSFVGALTGNASGSAATVTGASQTAITTLSNLVTTGALNSGSITSGFGAIDIGTSTLAAGSVNSSGEIKVAGSVANLRLLANGVELTFDRNTTSYIRTTHASGALQFTNNGNNSIYLASTGAVTMGSTLAVSGATTLTGGAYIGGTAAANLLDDYEEGTFTPTLTRSTGGAITAPYTSQNGTYTKIGNTVYIQIYIVLGTIASQGSAYSLLTGLPFTSSQDSYTQQSQVSGNMFSPTDVTKGFASSSSMYFGTDSNTNFPPLQLDYVSNGVLRICGTYKTS